MTHSLSVAWASLRLALRVLAMVAPLVVVFAWMRSYWIEDRITYHWYRVTCEGKPYDIDQPPITLPPVQGLNPPPFAGAAIWWRDVQLISARGGIKASYWVGDATFGPNGSDWRIRRDIEFAREIADMKHAKRKDPFYVRIRATRWYPSGSGSFELRSLGFDWGGSWARYVVVPHWFILVLTLICPLWRLHRIRIARKRKKMRLCLKCGYDLRASNDRCPECGTLIPPAPGDSAKAHSAR